MFKRLLNKIIGDPNDKIMDRERQIVEMVEALEPRFKPMTDDELREQTSLLRQRHFDGETLDELLPEAYALIREASRRTTGMRHYDVQVMGGSLLHTGYVIEMRTGEGKTLVGTLPLYLNALTGRGVHLVTVNDYLVRRDGGWMGKIFYFLGLSVGCIGSQQFSALYDPDYVNPGADLEDERLVHWRPCTRKECYEADITYGTASEFGFDYLRDNMVTDREKLVQREQYFAIIDEVDNVLIDEARTPLIISGPAGRSSNNYVLFAEYVRGLRENTAEEDQTPNGHYDIDHKSRSVTLTDMGIAEIERRVPDIDHESGDSLYDPRHFTLTYYLDNAMKAEYLFHRDKEYIVTQDGQVVIVDEMTGRPMPGRRYSDGLHEAIEAKEGVEIMRETVTVATITLQNYFRMYEKLSGMTGTAMTDAEEFDKIYQLGVFPLPTNVQYIYDSGKLNLREVKERVDGAEKVTYLDKDTGEPRYFRRIDFPDQVYGSEDAKDRAIVAEVKAAHDIGRPVLVGTTSVEHSEVIGRMLRREKIHHRVLNAKMHQSEALVVAQAGRRGAVTISTNMAGRGTDILLGGNPEGLAAEKLEQTLFNRRQLGAMVEELVANGPQAARSRARKEPKLNEALVDAAERIRDELDAVLDQIEKHKMDGFLARHLQEKHGIDYAEGRRIVRFVQGGALDTAREHVRDAGIDTIVVEETAAMHTLYSEYQAAKRNPRLEASFLADQVFDEQYNARAALVRAVLGGKRDEAQEIVDRVAGLTPDIIAMIEEIVQETAAERREVWQLGGLHVVGSERHESRRIDNQLRGRAARQGDPGSSRFFLSLDDELMLRFGGERLNNLMNRINIPEDMPIESGVLDRLIESSQSRLEGYNFDIRKNLVEYDDVMNRQRAAIYRERREILMSDDVDLDAKIDAAFQGAIGDLAQNYLIDYRGYVQGEINRAIVDFSTEATGDINVRGVVYRLRSLLPSIVDLRESLEEMPAAGIVERLMQEVDDNIEKGTNVYQLLQAMGSFLPLVPVVPNLGTRLAMLRAGRLQERESLRRDFIGRLEELHKGFLANYVSDDAIWQKALNTINDAFLRFNVERANVDQIKSQQPRFKAQVDDAMTTLLLDSLSQLDSDQLIAALNEHVQQQAERWRKIIGPEEYRNYQRLLLLSGIDREWRDYLTAMDDLRREIGLSAVAQRDPKVEYKRRSFEMFQDMRNNIDRDVVNRFFSGLPSHQRFVREQEERAQQRTVLSHGGAPQPASTNGQQARRAKPKRRREHVTAGAAGDDDDSRSRRKYRRRRKKR